MQNSDNVNIFCTHTNQTICLPQILRFRTLLEAESTRLQIPMTDFKLPSSFRDVKLEASNSKLQAISLDRGLLGSRDLRPSPITFLKGNAKPQLLKNQTESFRVDLASKNKSPVSREFQKTNTVLQSQSTKSFDAALPQKDAPTFVNGDAFKMDSSQQHKVVMATKNEMASQLLLQEALPKFSSIGPIISDISEEPSSTTEQRYQKEDEDRDGTATEMVREQMAEGEFYEEVEEEEEEEEEKQLSEEPPGETIIQNLPYSSQLVTEALEMAIKEVNGGDVHLEARLFDMVEAQNGIPADNSLSMEEENGAASLPSTGVLEGATQKVHRDEMGDEQPIDQVRSIKVFEDSLELNGGSEACGEQQEPPAAEVAVFCDAELPSPLETGLVEQERIREDVLEDRLVAGETESYKEARSSEWNESSHGKQPPALQDMGPREDAEHVSEGTESVSQLGPDVPAIARGEEERWERGSSHLGDHAGAAGGYLEEMDGGAEDLEVMSTEALHLSEDEERRELWSPSRENEEYDLQAEILGSELLHTERGFTVENLSPISHTALPAESCQENLFLLVEKFEEQETLLCKTDSALLEEEKKERVLEPESFSVEETFSSDESSTRDKEITLEEEPRAIGRWGSEEEDGGKVGEDIFRHKEESALGDEDPMKKEGLETVRAQDGAHEPNVASQDVNVENVLHLESSTEGQTQGRGEASQGEVLVKQEVDSGEESTVAPHGAEGDVLKGEDLTTSTEAAEGENKERTGTLEMEEAAGHLSTNVVQDSNNLPRCSEAGRFRTGAHHAEAAVSTGNSEPLQSRHAAHLEQSPVQDISEELEALSGAQSDTIGEPEAQGHADTSYDQSPSDYAGSADSPESLDTSPNATCERDGAERGLESGRHLVLEETLPDHTPLHLYDGQTVAVPGNSQSLPESPEAAEVLLLIKDSPVSLEGTRQVSEEDPSVSPQAEACDHEEEDSTVERSCSAEAASSQDTSGAKELPTSKYLEEAETETSELVSDNKELLAAAHERASEEDSFALDPIPLDAETDTKPTETFQQGNDMGKDAELIGQVQDEEAGTDSAWESEKDSVFQASSNTEGKDGPLELSDQVNKEAEGPRQVSPLTSVADLGEVILEGDVSLGGETGVVESDVLSYEEDGNVPHARDSLQISDLEGCGTEDPSQQREEAEAEAEADPSGTDCPDPLPGPALSISVDSMKDSDILEIVEQALEFNQELIKAAEHHVEAELTATAEEVGRSLEEKSQYVSIPSSDRGESQIFTEAPESSSLSARNSTGPSHLWVENNANGMQDFTKEILNGIEHFPGDMENDVGSSREELIKKVTITQQFHKEEPDDLSMVETVSQSLSQTEEEPRAEEVSAEVLVEPFLDQKGLETTGANENRFAEIMQTSCVKGKGAEMEAIINPPQFREEILSLESSQHLKFQPEDDEL
ncbi:nestin [Varanus komodoensis]|uniref:nestin n=1 Tax=Varanus komodoensis TaxID=61221 RepID=UPI001CF7720B|nr:nestin [Varanus komodoensis]